MQLSKIDDARICLTAAGVLIVDHRVLLIKHKLVGLWLPPGGHLEGDELPHKAAEREFWEETALNVRAISKDPLLPSVESEYLPNPFASNLHWISKSRYEKRLKGTKPLKDERRCEQHMTLVYLMKPMGSLDFRQNVEETDGISWFAKVDLPTIDTTRDIKQELMHAFDLVAGMK